MGPQAGEKTRTPEPEDDHNGRELRQGDLWRHRGHARQDIDWTSPSAWDILVRDLADQYAIQTETVVAAAFKTAATHAAIPVATNTLADWTKALYLAAADSYVNSQRMPDRIWCSLDVWAALGALVDVGRVVFPADAAVGGDASDAFDSGGSSLTSFRGDVLGMPRIVVPTFPAGTCIVGPSSLFEVYEEVIQASVGH